MTFPFRRVMVTGGAGFIGSNLVRALLQQNIEVVNVDWLTYAGNLDSLADMAGTPGYAFVHADIVDGKAMAATLALHKPDAIFHLAAESHVDRSIENPSAFIQTNVVGTHALLEAALAYWKSEKAGDKETFRFLHVSTDEVFGSLGPEGLFREDTPYAPNSPYSASKAASDHLVRAYHHTFGLPTVTTNCSNNYGPYQFPEKLIPHMILCALDGKNLPVYGDGANVRDWLYVADHVAALIAVMRHGRLGETYNIGGRSEQKNIDVVKTICSLLNRLAPESPHRPFERLITFVTDRPGHDRRYAIDSSKIETELGWKQTVTFETGLAETVQWYLNNLTWCRRILDGSYRLERLGEGTTRV